MITPRPYLSFSQMTLFERSPEKYADQYIYGKKQRISRNMAYGAQMAEGLESEGATGDPLLDLMMIKLPKFELMDKPLMAELPNGKEKLQLLAKPDTAKADYSAFKEYKTSTRQWTQKMADESTQITFYSMVIWLVTKRIPKDIELINVPVEYEDDGKLQPTGEIVRLPTTRSMADIIRMVARARRAWEGITALCERELI